MEKARFKWVLRERNRKIAAKTEVFTEQQARRVRSFHSSFKEYSPTPLIELTSLAQHLGIKNLLVKDESYRFGLNAFKVICVWSQMRCAVCWGAKHLLQLLTVIMGVVLPGQPTD